MDIKKGDQVKLRTYALSTLAPGYRNRLSGTLIVYHIAGAGRHQRIGAHKPGDRSIGTTKPPGCFEKIAQ